MMSSPRSECVKGHITRVGSRIVKGVSEPISFFPCSSLTSPISPSFPSNQLSLAQCEFLVNRTSGTDALHPPPYSSTSQLHHFPRQTRPPSTPGSPRNPHQPIPRLRRRHPLDWGSKFCKFHIIPVAITARDIGGGGRCSGRLYEWRRA